MTLPVLALAWLLSFAVCGIWGAPWWMTAAWLLALLPAIYLVRGPASSGLCVWAALAAAAGGALFSLQEPESAVAPAPFGTEFTAEGLIASEPDPGLRSVRYRVDLDSVSVDGSIEEANASVLITVNQYLRLLPGDRVALSGELQEPSDDLDGFDYRAYLLSQGVIGTMLFPSVGLVTEGSVWNLERASTRLRLAIEESLQKSLPEPEASLAAGIAVGRDDGMPPDVVDDFRASGLAHLTAVSGGNVAILSAILFALAVPLLGRRLALFPAVALIVLYLVAAGFEPSIVRASIMAGVFLVGLWLGRPQSGLAGLAAAVIVMTALNPEIARDVGFQLSLAATAGLIVLSPWIQSGVDLAFEKARMRAVAGSAVSQAFAMTLAATIATMPIVAHTFGRVSLIGLLANVIAAPVFAVAFALSLATAITGMVHPAFGWTLGLAAYYPLAFLTALADAAAGVPGASVPSGEVTAGIALVWCAIYVATGAWLYLRVPPRPAPAIARSHDRLIRRALVATAAGTAAAWIGVASIAPLGGPGRLEISVLNVGQGDAILLRAPGGETILIDGGPSGMQVARELGGVLPHWQRDIDLVVLTHPHEDHVAGLVEVLSRFEIGKVASTGADNSTLAYDEFARRAGDISVLAAGDAVTVGGVRISVLWPPQGGAPADANDGSLVLRVEYGTTSALLTGDIESGAQLSLVEAGGIGAQLLKVPHHGSGASDPRFFETVGATVAAISVGAGNRFGHPAEATLAALDNATIFRTDIDGRMTFRSDGSDWTVETGH